MLNTDLSDWKFVELKSAALLKAPAIVANFTHSATTAVVWKGEQKERPYSNKIKYFKRRKLLEKENEMKHREGPSGCWASNMPYNGGVSTY